MVTFTLPEQLRGLCIRDPQRFYKIFFACAARAIKDVLKQPRHLAGRCGFFGMLQTWTQELALHPHIHFIIPAIGLGRDGRIKHPARRKWLARGDVFAARLRTLMLDAFGRQQMFGPQQLEALWSIKFNCDVANFGDGAHAIKYLGAYLHKGPIGDSRILAVDENTVTIRVRDRAGARPKEVRIDGAEFVHRYLQHVLPGGFHRLRYFGFLHPRARKTLAAIRAQLGSPAPPKAPPADPPEPPVVMCPHCRRPMALISQRSRAPPHLRVIHHLWNSKPKAAA
jgi:hypothetical protein